MSEEGDQYGDNGYHPEDEIHVEQELDELDVNDYEYCDLCGEWGHTAGDHHEACHVMGIPHEDVWFLKGEKG